ncbi:MAG: hypothetical protein IKO44_00360 [Ruminococcus sp.]|nr:hypothetical protein [Ruminococcus sp.]
MGVFSKIVQAYNAAQERQRIANEERYRRMQPYFRGYDVFPEGFGSDIVSQMRGSFFRRLMIEWMIFAAICIALVLFRAKAPAYYLALIGGGIVLLILFFVSLGNLKMLARMLMGKYDVYGAMVTHKRVTSHTHTDSDGQTDTTYTYYVELNGIECQVSSIEYKKVAEEQYCRFLRIRKKYIKDDSFFLYPCELSVQEQRVGQHYPDYEPRLYMPAANGCLSAFIAGLFCVAAVTFAAFSHYKDRDLLPKYINDKCIELAIGCGVMFVLILVINRVVTNSKEKKLIEEKERQLNREQNEVL